jgi:ubiquinone/menaquinone biosynthesis C-methylase UbiE
VDPNAIKDAQRRQWGSVAAGWYKHGARIEQLTRPVTDRLLELAGVGPGHHVLDVACGTGDPALPAARVVGERGRVLGVDQAPEMVDFARQRARSENITYAEFRVADGEELDVEPGSFDAVTCRWGIMFMPEPWRCLRQAFAALKPGGRIAVSVWGPRERSPFQTVPLGVVAKYLDEPLPDSTLPGGLHSFADESKLERTLADAGFRDVAVEGLELVMEDFDSGREYWTYRSDISAPLQAQLAKLPPDVREKVAVEIATAAGGGDPNGPVRLTGYTLLASGVK